MTGTPDQDGLGAFLRARRRELSARAAGLPDGEGRRRVPGLRREEVALLAAIGTDYYARIEQGRGRPSSVVLNRLARVLHLDDGQRERLYALAARDAGGPRRCPPQRTRPQLRRLLDGLSGTPALVLGRRMDVLAWNPLAAALVTDFAGTPAKRRNYVRLLFTDPAVRALYADWPEAARAAVAHLRAEAARDTRDVRLTELVGELSIRDEDFRRWWSEPHNPAPGIGAKVLRHPVVGELTLHWDAVCCSDDPDQQLVTLTAEPGSRSQDGLRILASWAAGA
ncbi:helix-turn-helix domain-containing protein [Streptomyces sp. NPDC003688]